MKDIHSAFGTVIAFLLPGLFTLASIAIWNDKVHHVISTFLTENANGGLAVLVLLASVAIGLNLSALRNLIFERWQRIGGTPPDFGRIATKDKFPIFQALAEQHYRYHQFYGNTAIAMLVFVGCMIKHGRDNLAGLYCVLIIAALLLAVLNSLAAVHSLRAYRTKATDVANAANHDTGSKMG